MPAPILIVEDEAVVLNFAQTVLKNRGHEVMAARSVAEARAIMGAEPTRRDLCLVIDVVLEHDSGIAFAEELVKTDPHRRVLLMSGFTDDVLLGEPELADRVGFLRKPFTKEELVLAVDSLCSS
jgi:two-component system, cell cycle sensor histidine kinase and response regulator CckA